ncbi:outer membrane protein [Larkinella arboricola]
MKTSINRIFFLVTISLTTSVVLRAQETDTLRRETPATTTTPPPTDTTMRVNRTYSDAPLSYFNRPGSPWFRSGAFLLGASIGFGTGKGQGLYTVFSPRAAYFVQRGLAVGFRGAFESRANTSFRANSAGAFLRYYPVRNNFYVYGEGGFNVGKFKSSDVGPNDRRGFSSINIGIGMGLKVAENLSVEAMIENNYYDKAPVYSGNNRGPQIKVGINYHFPGRDRYY